MKAQQHITASVLKTTNAINRQSEQLQSSMNKKRDLDKSLHQLRNEIFVDTTSLNAYEAYRFPEKEIEPSVFFYDFINFYQQKAPDLLNEDQEKIDAIILAACEALPAKNTIFTSPKPAARSP